MYISTKAEQFYNKSLSPNNKFVHKHKSNKYQFQSQFKRDAEELLVSICVLLNCFQNS